jgi:formamidopyrimidine-DNA glycosylase
LNLPELPEVETICRALRSGGRNAPAIVGWKINRTDVLWQKTLAEPGPEEFLQRLEYQVIIDVRRRGKFIVIHLSDDFLIVHLRMSGDIRVDADTIDLLPHDRLVIWFQNGYHLAFNDTRKFGRVWLRKDLDGLLHRLGPEPLEIDDAEDFYQRLITRKRQLKPLLMDQTFISGMGNIYTDEALHIAGIHPLSNSAALTREQALKLLSAIQQVLKKGIERNGASIDWIYRGGSFQNEFRVYGRSGQACPICGTLIEKIVVGQRGTHFCPVCQPGFRSFRTIEKEG